MTALLLACPAPPPLAARAPRALRAPLAPARRRRPTRAPRASAQGPTGEVVPGKLPSPLLTNWKRGNTIQDMLLELRRSMTRPEYKKLSQPEDGLTYS